MLNNIKIVDDNDFKRNSNNNEKIENPLLNNEIEVNDQT
jgi:hypothetical protein